jgi:hypothetical protein
MSTAENLYPRDWDWDADGNTADGKYVQIRVANTQKGPRPIMELEINGEIRSIWLTPTSLFGQVKNEVKRRPKRDFDKGERLIITRGDKRQSKTSTYMMWPYTLKCPDQPPPKAADLLAGFGNAGDQPDYDDTAEPELPTDRSPFNPEDDDGDDIPY